MKRLLMAFTFVVLGLTASANTKEIKEMDLSQSQIDLLSSHKALEVTFDCGGGLYVTVCCFDSYMDAAFYAYFARPCPVEPEVPAE